MKRLTRTLLDSSIDAFVLALETINKLSVAYRVQAFVFLFCNAWELLLKAKLLNDGERIFHRKRRRQPRRSLSLDDCLRKVFTSANDPVKENVLMVSELRNEAMHLVLPFVPRDIMGLFQAGVLNYPKALQEWFALNFSDRVPIGMMTLVYDFDPAQHSLESARMRRKLKAEVIRYLEEFQDRVRDRAVEFPENGRQFYVPIDIKLAVVRSPDKADVVLSAGKEGEAALIVEVPKDSDRTHPFRQKEVIVQVRSKLPENVVFNQHDMQCVKKVFKIPAKSEFFYQSKIPGRSPQYSQPFVEWVLTRYNRDLDFFKRAREQFASLRAELSSA